jgi:hypothetical protein
MGKHEPMEEREVTLRMASRPGYVFLGLLPRSDDKTPCTTLCAQGVVDVDPEGNILGVTATYGENRPSMEQLVEDMTHWVVGTGAREILELQKRVQELEERLGEEKR